MFRESTHKLKKVDRTPPPPGVDRTPKPPVARMWEIQRKFCIDL